MISGLANSLSLGYIHLINWYDRHHHYFQDTTSVKTRQTLRIITSDTLHINPCLHNLRYPSFPSGYTSRRPYFHSKRSAPMTKTAANIAQTNNLQTIDTIQARIHIKRNTCPALSSYTKEIISAGKGKRHPEVTTTINLLQNPWPALMPPPSITTPPQPTLLEPPTRLLPSQLLLKHIPPL